MDDKKKIAAASAIIAYLKEEEEIACAQAMQSTAVVQTPLASAPTHVNPWGTDGRLAQMQLRTLMQLKAFHGLKIR